MSPINDDTMATATAEDTLRWELSILFNGSQEQAEQMLLHIDDVARTMNKTVAAGVTQIMDLKEWEACRCGR